MPLIRTMVSFTWNTTGFGLIRSAAIARHWTLPNSQTVHNVRTWEMASIAEKNRIHTARKRKSKHPRLMSTVFRDYASRSDLLSTSQYHRLIIASSVFKYRKQARNSHRQSGGTVCQMLSFRYMCTYFVISIDLIPSEVGSNPQKLYSNQWCCASLFSVSAWRVPREVTFHSPSSRVNLWENLDQTRTERN